MKKKSLILSIIPLIPFALLFLEIIYQNIIYTSASNHAALGMGIVFFFFISFLPCFIISIISLKKANSKLTKIISLIDIVLWSLMLLFLIIVALN